MKRMLFWVLVLMVCACMLPVLALAESWACEACGSTNNMNFCGNCGSERPKWTCAKCETKNAGNECAGCGLTQDASEILTKYDITPQIDIAPILKNGEVNGSIFEIDATDTVYMGNYSLNAYFFPSFDLVNKTDESQTCSIALKISGKTANWNEMTIAGKGFREFYADETPLTAGTYEYKFYIDSVEVAAGQYRLVEGTSPIAPRNYPVYAGLRIKDYETGSLLLVGLVGTDTVDVSSLKTNQKYEPVLILDNSDGLNGLHFRDGTVGAIANNEEAANWLEAYIEPNSRYYFRYNGAPLKQGENEIVWFIDGQEVARDTFTITGEPSEMGK